MNSALTFFITVVVVLGVLILGAVVTCVATVAANGDNAVLAIGTIGTLVGAIVVAIKLPTRLRRKTPPSAPA